MSKKVEIPERLKKEEFRFVRVEPPGANVDMPGKQPKKGQSNWQEDNNDQYDSKRLQRWLKRGNNYGVVCGFGDLVVIDVDDKRVKEAVEETLPKTFKVLSGSGEGRHYYYKCPDLRDPIRMKEEEMGDLGDVQSEGKMVVGPNSRHPSGHKYVVLKNREIAEVKAPQIRKALSDFTQIDYAKVQKKKKRENDLPHLDISDVVDTAGFNESGGELQGPHPVHESTTGTNLNVNPTKNVWHCWRHDTGGGPWYWLAVREGIINCSEATLGTLRGEKFKEVLKVAVEEGLADKEVLGREKEVKGAGEDFKVWINELRIKKRVPYGTIHIKINGEEYIFDDKKISLHNIQRTSNFVAEAEGLEDEKATEIGIKIFSLKKEAKKKAYESSSEAETQIEKEELDIKEEEVEEILKKGYFPELLEEIDEVHKGDKSLKLISVCSGLSKAINDKPSNLWNVGESGKGKTHLFRTIFKTIPKELRVKFNACSPKALYYFCQRYGEDALDGKIVFFNEVEASEEASTVLRSITDPSEKDSRLLTVIDQDSVEINIKGSPVTWFTSVNPLEDSQLKNRFMFGNVEEETDLDDEVAEHQKKYGRKGILSPIGEQNFDVLKGCFRRIIKETKDLQPIIPFDYEWKKKSDRRLQPMFLNLLFSITKSNYKNRPVRNGKILVTLEDYIIAKKLFSDFVEITTGKVRERDLEILKEIPEDKSQWVSRGNLQEKTNYSYGQIRHSTARLCDAGYLKKDQPKGEWKYWKVQKDVAKSCVSLKKDSLSNKSILKSLKEFNFIAKISSETEGGNWSVFKNQFPPPIRNISLATNIFSLEEIKEVLKGERALEELSQQIAKRKEEKEKEKKEDEEDLLDDVNPEIKDKG